MLADTTPSIQTLGERFAHAVMRVSLPDIDRIVRHAGDVVRADVDRHEAAAWLVRYLSSHESGLEAIIRAWLADTRQADTTFFNTLWWADKAFEIWSRHSHLDDFIKRAFRRRRFVFAAILLEYTEFVFDDGHALARMIDLLENLFQGWTDEGEAPPDYIYTPLKRFSEFLDHPDCLDEAFRERVLQDIEAAWKKEAQRRERLEQRLIDSERGLDQAWVSQKAAIHTVNEALEAPLPPDAIRFLTGPWLDSLRLIYLDEGHQSKKGRIAHAMTQNMAWLLAPRSPEERQRQLSLGARILDYVEPLFISLDSQPEDKVRWLDTLQALILEVLKGHDPERVNPERLPEPEADGVPAMDSEDVAVQCWVGRWFMESGQRKKLLTWLPGRRTILWCDINGRKVGYQPVLHFLEALAAHQVVPLDEAGTLRLALQRVAKKLVELDEQQQARRRHTEEKRAELIRLAREKAAREAERLRELRESLKLPEPREEESDGADQDEPEKTGADASQAEAGFVDNAARAGSEVSDDNAAGSEAVSTSSDGVSQSGTATDSPRSGQTQPETRPAEPPPGDAMRMFRRILETLQADTWIRIDHEDGARKYRIAARLQSTGKLILANELGTRAGDLSWQEALELLSAGKLTILGKSEDVNARMTRAFGRVARRRKPS
ncbi:DUF1631 family protein [Hahella sp. SMD15-11]|uniref:DUF1631 family protein n=1 Tax=Thermohahella caldifontis TaxID=3142973 RepID=A0AB39UXI9_9GAMM